MIRMILLLLMLMVLTGCSSFSMLLSGGSIAVSQNTYSKIYNGVDILTMMSTDKSIKGHAYDNAKKAWTKVKEGKGYIYNKTTDLFGNKH